jgi:bifunctional UDP-N-acetylglucosamine pyrophosphorylase/glucosamine-1-phosphate N-acetyltransferase
MDPQESRGEPLDILILAAGLGTRMRSNTAKVLHKLDGRPLISHVCRTAAALAPRRVYVVVGHQGNEVKNAVLTELLPEQTVIVEQKEQLGTGDAVNAAREYLEDDDALLLILSGDVPMIRAETLGGLIQRQKDHRGRGAACTILTVRLKDPVGYGRVVRDSGGIFEKIVEQRDATVAEADINEINSGIYCFNARKLFAALSRVQNHNDQGEYYLTDVPALLKADGEDVALYSHGDAFEVEGVNNRMQLADLERQVRRRTVSRLMLFGPDYGIHKRTVVDR